MESVKEAMDMAMEAWFNENITDEIIFNGSVIRAHIVYGDGSTGTVADTAFITVQVTDVPNPQNKDTVIIGGKNWKVYKAEEKTGAGYTWRIPIKKDERANIR